MFKYGESEVLTINRICDDELYLTFDNNKIASLITELRNNYNELYRLWELFPRTCVSVEMIDSCYDRVNSAIKYQQSMLEA